MKHTITLIGLCLFGLCLRAESTAGAEATAETPSKVSFVTHLKSGYTDVDGTRLYKNPVSQSDLTIDLGHGFYVDDWFSTATTLKTTDGLENEFSVGWTADSIKPDNIAVDAGISYYDFATLFRGPKNDIYVGYLTLSKDIVVNDGHGKLTPKIELLAYKPGKGSDFEGGWRVRWSARYAHQLFSSELSYTPALIRDDGTFGSASAWVTSHTLSLDWKVGKVTVGSEVIVYLPLTRGRSAHTIYGLKISL